MQSTSLEESSTRASLKAVILKQQCFPKIVLIY